MASLNLLPVCFFALAFYMLACSFGAAVDPADSAASDRSRDDVSWSETFIREKFVVNSPKLPHESQDFDCAWRKLALEYSVEFLNISEEQGALVFDALELRSRCGENSSSTVVSRANKGKRLFPRPIAEKPTEEVVVTVVAPERGRQRSLLENEFESIQDAVLAVRSRRAANKHRPPNALILLSKGVHYVHRAIELDSRDSFLEIRGERGAIMSGAVRIEHSSWEKVKVDPQGTWHVLTGANNGYARVVLNNNTYNTRFLGKIQNASTCQDECIKFSSRGPLICRSYVHQASTGGCYAVIDGSWSPVPQKGFTSGRLQTWNVYKTKLHNHEEIGGFTGLLINGRRATLARYPDANTEESIFPSGWMMTPGIKKWLPPKPAANATTVTVQYPCRDHQTMFQKYTIGVGGPCMNFEPAESYWCSSDSAGGGASMYRVPGGVMLDAQTFAGLGGLVPLNESTIEGATMHVWRQAHWALWMFTVASWDSRSHTITFGRGGFQGARGAEAGQEFFIENFLPALDSPNEFFYDESSHYLFYFHNSSSAQPPANDMKFEAMHAKTLLTVSGSMLDPVHDFSLTNVVLTGTKATFMEPHGVPSGGDWSLHRGAAVQLLGTLNARIIGNQFMRLDGNALLISGWNRDTQIERNIFALLGGTATISWGDTEGIDGTSGTQPFRTSFRQNFGYGYGIFEKQAALYFQAKSSRTFIEGNIAFNGPRVAINFDDGFGGANVILSNLVFNQCRESSDNGPFNSWDRQPYLTTVATGEPSLIPAYNHIHRNFFVANYGSSVCIDNDDGSSYYDNDFNFEVFGGHKSDYGGFKKTTSNSILAFAQDYKEGLCGMFNKVIPGYADSFVNNICIQGVDTWYIELSYDDSTCPLDTPSELPHLGNNTIMRPTPETIDVWCHGERISLEKFQELGYAKGTTATQMPLTEDIISWARSLLLMASTKDRKDT